MGHSQRRLRERKGFDSSGDIHPVIEPPDLEAWIHTKADALPGALPGDWAAKSMQEKWAWYYANA